MSFKKETTMKRIFSILILCTLFCIRGNAAIKVVTSIGELAWVAKEIGQDRVAVEPLLSGVENPHYVETIPDFIRKVADAQVVCVVGLDLEIGWMPKVLSRSGNAKVQPGGIGYCEAGKSITVLEKPTGAVDRSMGDVHPSGNPHFWLSPIQLEESSKEVLATLIRVDPTNRTAYETGQKRLSEKLKSFFAEQKKKFPKALPPVMEYHKEFTYFLNAYGLTSVGSLEEKPGIAPSAGRIAEVAVSAKKGGVAVLFAADYSPKRTLEKFHELSGVDSLRLATSVSGQSLDYYTFHAQMVDKVVAAIVATLKKGPPHN